MTAVLQVVLGTLIFLAYWWAALTLVRLPFVVAGVLLHWIRPTVDFRRLIRGRYIYVELLAAPLLAVALLVLLFSVGGWTQSWVRLWEHPTLAGLLLAGAVVSARGTRAYFPAARQAADFTFIFVWPLLALFVVMEFESGQLELETFKWSLTAMLSAFAALNVVFVLPARKQMSRFASLDERDDKVRERISRLNEIRNILGETQSSQTIREALENARDLEKDAVSALRHNKLDDAEAAIIPAEMEIDYVDSLFSNRIRLSLPNEIESRLRSAETDLEDLRKELAQAGVEEGRVADLHDAMTQLLREIADKELSEDELIDRVQDANRILRDIQDTRTALRFRQNLESTISAVREEVGTERLLLATASALRMDTAEAKRALSTLEDSLRDIESGVKVTSEQLVETYQAIQKERAKFRGAMRSLEEALARGWHRRDAFEGAMTVYWPATCSTGGTVEGAAVVRNGRGADGKGLAARVEVGGTLLELPEPRILTVAAVDGDPYGLRSFSFAGKHGGVARLTVDMEYLGKQEHVDGTVRVVPGLGESLAIAAGFGGVISAVAILALRAVVGDWGVSASVGAVIGGLAGPLLAALRLLWLRRGVSGTPTSPAVPPGLRGLTTGG